MGDLFQTGLREDLVGEAFLKEFFIESMNTEALYQRRLKRYVTAMRNEKPDQIPIRPFVAEFTAKYAGYTCQEVAHDYTRAFDAAVQCAKGFEWDAVVPNMVYVWTGLAQALGLRYYGIPGIHIPHTTGFNYIEPPEENAFMREDEYDELIDDPTAFLYNVWLPRVSTEVASIGEASSYRNNLAMVKTGMAMMQYFGAFGPQIERLRNETGTVSAIAGIFKSPFDIIADKMRGYIGLTMDMATQPEKVLKACEALMPHLCHVGLTTADPNKQVPIGFWMHRGCVPFVNPKQFDSHYWPTLKPIVEEFWKHGHQTLFYAEGKWNHHFDTFRELPERSIVYHCDQDDIFDVHRRLHDRFAISGGIPNTMLSFGTPEEVRDHCLRIIKEVAVDGGYIMDASAIMQDDTDIDNMRALTDTCREHGIYPPGSFSTLSDIPPCDVLDSPEIRSSLAGMDGRRDSCVQPGVCLPWEKEKTRLPELSGDQDLLQNVWEGVDALGNTFIWQCLLSF